MGRRDIKNGAQRPKNGAQRPKNGSRDLKNEAQRPQKWGCRLQRPQKRSAETSKYGVPRPIKWSADYLYCKNFLRISLK